jgi:gamma-glutamyltranspeptidase/glutathione hydrolase
MTTSPTGYSLEQGDVNRPPTSRPVVYATQGVISSGHYLTSMAGMRMLLTGGNAFDAVVASTFAAAVVEPIASYSLAAEGVFMLYDAKSGDLLSLSGQGTAPGKATVDFYKSQGLDAIPTGPGHDKSHLSFTVPGVVAALISMLERYGTKTVAEVLAPSIQYAERGIPHYEYMLERLAHKQTLDQFALYPPGGINVFYDNGKVPKPGSILVQPGLVNIFRKMVAAESAAAGSRIDGIKAAGDCFYRGEIAQMIADCSQSVGGILGMDDLANYEAKYEEPVKTSFMGHEVHGQSTWTQGLMLMQVLNMLESFDLKGMRHNSPAYIHTCLEAFKLAFADREAYYGDPEFATVPIDGLLSKQYAAERAKLINHNRAHPNLPEAGDPWKYSRLNGTAASAPVPAASVGGDGGGSDSGTTHIAAIDRDGNLVCSTPSGGAFAKSVFFEEIGCAISTRMEMLNFVDGHPNRLEPNKRPRTTLINYLVSKNGTPVMTVGCPGGDHQAQANIQLVLNALVFGMNPQEAIEAPRFATESVTNSFYPHTYYPGRTSVEHGFSDSTLDALRDLGHNEIVTVATCGMGATITRRDPETGALAAGSDPRRACHAIGW